MRRHKQQRFRAVFLGGLVAVLILGLASPLVAAPDKTPDRDLHHLQETLAANALILQTRSREKQALERDLARTEQDLAAARATYQRQNQQMQTLLIALQRLARTPPETILSQPDSPEQVVRGGILLRAAIETLERRLIPLRADLAQFEALRQKVTARKAALSRLSDDLQQQDQQLEALMAQRQQSMATQPSAPPADNSAVETATGIGDLVEKLDSKTVPAPGSPDAPNWVLPIAGWQATAPIDLANQDSPGNGLWLTAPPGSVILSPADGIIRYNGPFRGYGNILIVEHGGGFHSLLAGVDSIMVTTGQHVLGGEPIARLAMVERAPNTPQGVAGLPPATTFRTPEASKQHPLYFEVRYHGKSEMPDRLVALLKKKDSIP